MRLFFLSKNKPKLITSPSFYKPRLMYAQGVTVEEKPRISEARIANIITVVTAALICIIFTVRLESKTEINAENIKHNSQEISKIEARTDIQYREITRLLERINDKLDSKADKEHQ